MLSPEGWILEQKNACREKSCVWNIVHLGFLQTAEKGFLSWIKPLRQTVWLLVAIYLCVHTSPTYLHVLLWQQHRNDWLLSWLSNGEAWQKSMVSFMLLCQHEVCTDTLQHCATLDLTSLLCDASWVTQDTHWNLIWAARGSGLRCFCWNAIGITLQKTYKCSQLSHWSVSCISCH